MYTKVAVCAWAQIFTANTLHMLKLTLVNHNLFIDVRYTDYSPVPCNNLLHIHRILLKNQPKTQMHFLFGPVRMKSLYFVFPSISMSYFGVRHWFVRFDNPKVKNIYSYVSIPWCLHGVVLN
jgi:hypothetical protein